MKRIISMAFFAPLFLCAQEGIQFENGLTWNQVLQKAKNENKYIFMDCYATWCGPCKEMDKTVYTNDTVADYFNEKFISVKVQMDTSKADNDHIRNWYRDAGKLRSKYKVSAFPTFLFFSPNGDIVHRDVGGKWPQEFVIVGENALNADKQYYKVLQKIRRNEMSASEVKLLLWKVQEIEGGEFTHQIANDYINRLPVDSLFTLDNIAVLYNHTRSPKDRGFVIIRDSAKRLIAVDERLTEVTCKGKVLAIINGEAIKPYTTTKKGKPDWKKIKANLKKYGSLGDEAITLYKPDILFKTEIKPALETNADWNQILPRIQNLNLGPNAEFVVGSSVVYYMNGVVVSHTEKNCKNLVAAATYYADSFSTFLTDGMLNQWSWLIFEHSTDTEELNRALTWSKHALELKGNSPNPMFIDTYANLLYKLGRVQEGIEWEEKAAKVENDNAKKADANPNPEYQLTVEKMKEGKRTWPDNMERLQFQLP